MVWIAFLVFSVTLIAVLGGYLILGPGRIGAAEIRNRLFLLEQRAIRQDDNIPGVLKDEVLSEVPFLHRLLAQFPSASRLDRRMKQADLTMTPGVFVLLSVVLLVVGAAGGVLLHWPSSVAIVFGVLLLLLPNAVVNIRIRRRLKRFSANFPEALEMFARSLRAGHSFTGAVQLVAQEMPKPVGTEFQKVFDEQNMGIPLKQALLSMAERVDSLDVKFFVTALLIQRETGGNLAEIIDKIAYVIRERFRIQGQVKVFTAQARMTGAILTFLPIAVALAIGAINPDYLKPLVNDPAGRFLLGFGIVLQITGMIVMRKIIRIKI